jgi:hypothetical protein
MQIEHTSVMRGPNFWSPGYNKLIVLKIGGNANNALSAEPITGIKARLHMMDHALPGAWIFLNTEKVFDMLQYGTVAKERDAQKDEFSLALK